MLTSPTPSATETAANQTFDALLTGLSRPGTLHSLPGAAEPLIMDALLDRECRVFCADPLLMPKVLETGAMVAELPQADHAFLAQLQDLAPLTEVCMGSDLYPDDGATVVLRAHLTEGTTLRLSGPGIETTLDVQVAGLPDGFWQMREDLIRYPMGFDLFLIEGDRVMGLPRSTKVEVL